MNYCGKCGSKLADGACGNCAAKSTSSLSFESLEKSLNALEDISKGVRPKEAKKTDKRKVTAREQVEEVQDQVHSYGDHGESESEEEPPSEHDAEEDAEKGFKPEFRAEDEEEQIGPNSADEDAENETQDEDIDEERRARDEEDEGEGPGRRFERSASKKKAKKSLAEDAYDSSAAVQKAIDISPFLTDIVETLSDHLDQIRYDVAKSHTQFGYQRDFNYALAKALKEMGSRVKNLTSAVNAMGKQPAGIRKSDVHVVEKSFANGSQGESLTKSQMAANLASKMEAGDKSISTDDVLRVELYGEDGLRPELREKAGLTNKQ